MSEDLGPRIYILHTLCVVDFLLTAAVLAGFFAYRS